MSLSSIKKILGVLTDILKFGREKGWWEKNPSVDQIFRDSLQK